MHLANAMVDNLLDFLEGIPSLEFKVRESLTRKVKPELRSE